MSKKVKYWCDSGANIHSCREGEITLDELGITEDEWNSMSVDDKEKMMRDVALERLDWGYELVDA